MSHNDKHPRLAWRVEINDMGCIVFAATKAKATWIAVKSYWDAGYGRRGTWPRGSTFRKPEYDKCYLRNDAPKAWIEEYVRNSPNL